MSNVIIAVGYHVERALLLFVYSTIFVLCCLQIVLWWKSTKGHLKQHHLVVTVPVLLQSFVSIIIQIDFRLVFGIFNLIDATVMCFLIVQIIAVGIMLQLKRLVGFHILGSEEETRVVTFKQIVVQEIIFFFITSIAFALSLFLDQLVYFVLLFVGFLWLNAWVVKRGLRLIQILEYMMDNRTNTTKSKYLPIWKSAKRVIFWIASFCLAHVGIIIFFASQLNFTFRRLYEIKDPTIYQLSLCQVLIPVNIVTCLLFMYTWVIVPENCIWIYLSCKAVKPKPEVETPIPRNSETQGKEDKSETRKLDAELLKPKVRLSF
jgi:hypothetical protein